VDVHILALYKRKVTESKRSSCRGILGFRSKTLSNKCEERLPADNPKYTADNFPNNTKPRHRNSKDVSRF